MLLAMNGESSSSSLSSEEEDELETYLLLLLSDSNLPTGGFVASSGLESFHAHGLLHNSRPTSQLISYGSSSSSSTAIKKGPTTAPSQAQLSSATLSFARSTLHSYARSSFGFLARVHAAVNAFLDESVEAEGRLMKEEERGKRLSRCLDTIARLDHSYHTLLLNHVARRASKAQGIALLTLYSKAFAKPIDLRREAYNPSPTDSSTTSSSDSRISTSATLVDQLKLSIRRSASPSSSSQMHGHLPICWAVFSACLGLSLKKAVYLHLFLQARSLFSSSIRLNTLGPYLAHQVMRFQMRPIIEGIVKEMDREGCLSVGTAVPTEDGGRLGEEDGVQSRQDTMQVDEDAEAQDRVEAYTIADQGGESSTTTQDLKPKPFRNTATMSSSALTALRPKIQALRIGKGQLIPVDDDDSDQGWAWDWPEEQDPPTTSDNLDAEASEKGFWNQSSAPATTFPLGEIIQARHDQLHSRLFNS